jgi:hypothetical protein
MDKLEHYLDQICRSIGGPKSLRQHVRRELREHLLDAAAEHRAAGMSEDEALDRAMSDFGGPEEVRLGLEETHGHRLLPVVIEKAMQWKEKTMRAKWLWMTWAHLALAGVIVLEVMWLTFANMFLVPRFQKLMRVGVIDPAILEEERMTWMASFLDGLQRVGGRYPPWLLLSAAVVCGLFEWRVRSENKSFIRLSAWGTAAVVLMVIGILTAGSLVIPSYMVVMPVTSPLARPYAMQQFATIDSSIAALERSLANKNWDSIQRLAKYTSQAVNRLAAVAPEIQSLAPKNESLNLEKLRRSLTTANRGLSEVQQAAQEKDAGRVEAALQNFRELYEPIRKAAIKP